MQTQTEPTTAPADDLAHELALVTDQVRALADPVGAVDTIVNGLENLYAQGADADALTDIQAGAEELLAITETSTGALRSVLDVAQRIKAQRDQVQETLTALKQAMDDVNLSVPEVEVLFESVEEMMADEVWMCAIDSLYENIIDDIGMNTGFNWTETSDLMDVLRYSSLEVDHPVWNELRAWMERAQRAQKETDS